MPENQFFYGANGSGKSTISNFLLEQTEPQYGQCDIEWYNNSTTDILVYNKEFRKRNFKENIAGFFTLGRARIEEIEELEQLKKERLNKNEEYFKRKNTFSDKDKEEERTRKEFRDAVWNVILKRNEEDFREAFSGYRTNKDKFMEQVIAQYKKSHLSNETREDLKKRYNMLYSRKPEKCDMIVCAIKDLIITIQTIEKDEIWGKVIVGNNDLPISKLIEHLDNADWVNQGRSYIREEGICPFCQQRTITSDFKNQLNDFFSGEYEENIQHLKIIIPRYINATEQLIRNLEAICNNTKIIDIGGIDISKYDSLKESLKATFLTIISKMSNKEKEPSKKIVLSSSHSIIYELNDMIVSANQEIVKHNKMVDNYNDERNLYIMIYGLI